MFIQKEKEQELMTMNELIHLPVGTTLKKGTRQRILIGLSGFMMLYKTKHNSKGVSGVLVTDFLKWTKGAEIVHDIDEK